MNHVAANSFQPDATGQTGAASAADGRLDALATLIDVMDGSAQSAVGDSDKGTPSAIENHMAQVRLGMASSLFTALRARHAPTASHSLRVAIGCSTWAEHLRLPPDQRDQLEVAALLHDIGKIGVPDAVLKKPAALTPEERGLMARHRRVGFEILRHSCASNELLEIIGCVNAWYDGSRPGFARRGDQLPLCSRMIAIVDAFDSMTTDQIYRSAMPRERAIAELFRNAGSQFAPDLVENYCRLLMTDSIDVEKAVARRWLRDLDPHRNDQMWRLQPMSPADRTSPQELFYEKLLFNLYDSVIFIDVSGSILYWNKATERITGLPGTAVVDKEWHPELIGLADEAGNAFHREECPLMEVIRSRTQTLRRLAIRGRSNNACLIDAHCLPVVGRDGVVHGAALVMHDVTSEASLEKRVQTLHERATQDPLTKVANRAEFDRVQAHLVSSSLERGHPFSLIIADIDYFKRINDQYGHQAGDEALISFARQLRRFCRPGDLVARYGGEEFVLLCADCDNATATARAEEIRRELSETPQPMLGGKCMTASFGVTELQAGDTPETMLRRADRGLLQAKETGRNRVVQLGAGFTEEAPTESRQNWFSWLEGRSNNQLAEQTLAARVPLNMAVEKLRGFIADHEAELTSVEEGTLVLKVEGRNTPLLRRRADRPVPFLIEVTFDDRSNVADRTTLTLIHVLVRPVRSRDRRKRDIAERAKQLITSLKSYLMASEYEASPEVESED